MTTRELYNLIRQAWSEETTRDWKPENPAWGQCAVTALLVQDELGGTLMRGRAWIDDRWACSHYWNRLPDETDLDFTRHQFEPDVRIGEVTERERSYVLSFPETAARYRHLRNRFEVLKARAA